MRAEVGQINNTKGYKTFKEHFCTAIEIITVSARVINFNLFSGSLYSWRSLSFCIHRIL
jgi:hypothetical protein